MALTVGESDHNGSAVALARRSSYLYNNDSPEWLPRNIRATQSLSLNTVLRNTKPASLDATLADVGRRDGLGYGVRPAVTDVRHLRVSVLTRAIRALSIARRRRPSAGRVEIGDRDRLYGVESDALGRAAPTLLDTAGRPEWRPVAPR